MNSEKIQNDALKIKNYTFALLDLHTLHFTLSYEVIKENQPLISFTKGIAMTMCPTIMILLAFTVLNLSKASNTSRKLEIRWGNTFASIISSSTVPFDCKYNDKSVCCSTLAKTKNTRSQHNSHLAEISTDDQDGKHCTILREYIESPYERLQIEMAYNLSIPNLSTTTLVDFVTSQQQIAAGIIWLSRVSVHMKNPGTQPTADDYYYLSRFQITKTCPHAKKHFVWDEWIEPLSVHARHPFANPSECKRDDISAKLSLQPNYPGPVSIMDPSYILTLSGSSLYNNTRSKNNFQVGQRTGKPTKHFLLDAGSSTFRSSLLWFTCAYSQVRLLRMHAHQKSKFEIGDSRKLIYSCNC